MKMKKCLNRKIWATAKEYGIDRDMLHDIISNEIGKESLTELTDAEAESLIKRIQGQIGKCDEITKSQVEYIFRLLEIKFPGNPARREGWLKKFCNTSNIEKMSKQEATKCITLLKKV